MIIAVDPSGEGVTGTCLLVNPKTYVTSTVTRQDYNFKSDYWKAVVDSTTPPHQTEGQLVVENFVLYPDKAGAQSYSTIETLRLLGVLEYWFEKIINWQLAAEVMKRWTKPILEHEGIITLNKKNMAFNPSTKEHLCEHELDALRHAVHAYHFKKEKFKQW